MATRQSQLPPPVIPILEVSIDKRPTTLTNIPCKVDTRTVKDGKKECLITTTLAISEDPDDIRKLDSMTKSPNMSDAKPGTFSRETVADGDDKVTVETTRVTVDDVPTKKKGKDKNKDKKPLSETKPGIVTSTMVNEGGKPAVLTTTLVPMQGTPKGYETNVLDLLKSGFPGLNTVAEEDSSPCTVTIDTIPEGNKTTTVTKVSFKEPKEPEGLPCTVTSKTVKDGKKESLITTTLTISKEKANNQQIQSIPNGFPIMDDARPGTFTSDTITEGGKKFKVNTTKITEEVSKKKGFKGFKGFKGSKDKKPVTETRPGIMTTKLVRDGNKLGTLTTVVEPLQGMPKNYEHNIMDLQNSGFPGLNLLGTDIGKPCTVSTETASDGNRTTTTITTRASVDKPLPVSIPGFGIIPAEDTKPCIIAAKTTMDSNKATLITTVVSASRLTPGTDKQVPLEANDIDITGIIENPKDAKPGVFVEKVIGDSKEPTIVTGTLVTSDDNKPAYPLPKEMVRGQDKPAIVTSNRIECGDVLTTVTTTMIPIQELSENYQVYHRRP